MREFFFFLLLRYSVFFSSCQVVFLWDYRVLLWISVFQMDQGLVKEAQETGGTAWMKTPGFQKDMGRFL